MRGPIRIDNVRLVSFSAWAPPRGRTFHWIKDGERAAICGVRNRGWKRVLDMTPEELLATEAATECRACADQLEDDA